MPRRHVPCVYVYRNNTCVSTTTHIRVHDDINVFTGTALDPTARGSMDVAYVHCMTYMTYVLYDLYDLYMTYDDDVCRSRPYVCVKISYIYIYTNLVYICRIES